MLPRIESLKEIILTYKIIVVNKAIAPVIWHEAVTERHKEDIISTFYKFFIVLWLDNCSSQNTNWVIMSYFIFIVNFTDVYLETLELKYFDPGHTFMSAGSSSWVSNKTETKNICFEDFKECVENELSTQESPRSYLGDMVYIIAKLGSHRLIYITEFNGSPIELNFRNANILKNGFPKIKFKTKERGEEKKICFLGQHVKQQ